MRQRGRRSAQVIALNFEQPRLSPPAGLSAKERTLFNNIVAAVDPSHFRPSDIPLLYSYVQAILMTHRLARANKIDDWVKASRVALALATKLRVTPKSRIDAKTLGAQQLPDGRAPWHRDDKEDW